MSDDRKISSMLEQLGHSSRARATTLKLNSIEPRCFAPRVDATQARLAYGKLALPILERDLMRSKKNDNTRTREVVTSMAELLVNPEEISRAIELRIAEKLADLLISEDPYLRERVAIIYATMSRRESGSEAILQCPKILLHLSRGLIDPLETVRAKMSQVVEILARNTIAAEDLCSYGFIDIFIERIGCEKNNIILAIHLECLESLLTLNEKGKERAIEINGMEKLLDSTVKSDEEKVVAGALSCLAILCQEPIGKQKSIDLDILPILKELLDDRRRAIPAKATSVIVFATMTTRGKLRAFELEIAEMLVKHAVDSNDDRELRLASLKALSNIGQVPEARSILLSTYSMIIEDIDTCADPATDRHKNILLEIIRQRT